MLEFSTPRDYSIATYPPGATYGPRQMREWEFLVRRNTEILAKHTGQKLETIEKDTDRDNFLSATQAVSYGLVDKVLTSRTEALV